MYEAIIDSLTGKISIVGFLVMGISVTSMQVITNSFDIFSSLFGLFLGGITYLVSAYFFSGGGGDVIMVAVLGWCVGINNLIYIVIIASLVYLIQIVCKNLKDKKKPVNKIQMPYAPAVFIASAIRFTAELYYSF